ncbi:MAG: glycosyltransferase family 2 protein [Rhodospirillales bacterium]|nr:glycosyltransferase family 2 protein [Rhodospirillales bacterium]
MPKRIIEFSIGGNSDQSVVEGFYPSEGMGRWTSGTEGGLFLHDLPHDVPISVRMRLGPFIAAPKILSQRLRISSGSTPLYEGVISQNAEIQFTIPAAAVSGDGSLPIDLQYPDAVVPAVVSDSSDLRRIAFAIWDMILEWLPAQAGVAVVVGDSLNSRVERSFQPKVAAVTMVYNEIHYLPIWLKHYGNQVGIENCFVVDHGSDDGSTDFIGPASVVRIPRSPYEPHKQSSFNSSFCSSLLEWYDWVIYSDVDEIIMADPKYYSNLREYCSHPLPPVVTAIGLNIAHRIDIETDLDFSQPITVQRPYVFYASSMCKPLLISRPVRWSPGSHSSDAPIVFDRLYLFHLRWFDLKSGLRRLQKTREMAWARTDAGVHQRVSDSDMIGQYQGFGRLPPVDNVEFDINIEPIRGVVDQVMTSSIGRSNDLYKIDLSLWGQSLWRIPPRFIGAF